MKGIARIEHHPIGAVVDYVAEGTVPAAETNATGSDELYEAYVGWCRERGREALSVEAFVAEFDRLRELPALRGKIRKFGTRYFGIALARSPRGRGGEGSDVAERENILPTSLAAARTFACAIGRLHRRVSDTFRRDGERWSDATTHPDQLARVVGSGCNLTRRLPRCLMTRKSGTMMMSGLIPSSEDRTMQVKLKYVRSYTDRHGKLRIEYRRNHKTIAIRGQPGTDEFLAAYDAAKAQFETREVPKYLEATSHSSLRWLCVEYFKSAEFEQLAPLTQSTRRRVLESVLT